VPNAANGDTATISAGHTITVTDTRNAVSVTVNGTGVLQINNAGKLTVDTATVASGGLLEINGNGSPYAELIFPYNSGSSPALTVNQADGVQMLDHALITVAKTMSWGTSGSGSVKGLDDTNCQIAIGNAASASNVTLTLNLLVHGELQFVGVGAGANHNDGLANSGAGIVADTGTISLASSLEIVTDGSSADALRWKAEAGAILAFEARATQLQGRFYAAGSNSVLRFNNGAQVTTQGKLQMDCPSTVDVNGTGSFTFVGGYQAGNCGSPPSSPINSTSGDYTCGGC
jgi:hypothetical protein